MSRFINIGSIQFLSAGILCLILVAILLSRCTSSVDYNTQVKPILNEHCIACHGGVKQNGGFSLLTRDQALADTDAGSPAIIPGSVKGSEFIKRLITDDPEERMPFEKEPLSKEEIDILKKWVRQGAEWGVHWAYQPLDEEVEVASASYMSMGEGAGSTLSIDQFIQAKLDAQGLKSNPPASRSALLRRASLDIIGLPPSDDLINRYVREESISFEEVVSDLLASPAFGEKWASMWLDLARYADSKGFERDQNRSIWRYRDYVIRSFNSDKPYSSFLVEQLAGDLLENPTDEALIATGFHRNTTTNDEGGTDNEEFRVKAVMDRVSTTWEGLLGTTMACVQCHSHPYDPILHEDYYKSFAAFNNTRDADTHMDYPRLNFIDSIDASKLKEIKSWVSKIKSADEANQVASFARIVQPVRYSIEVDKLENAALYDEKYLGLRHGGSARMSQVELATKEALWIKANTIVGGGWLSIRLDQKEGEELGRIRLDNDDAGYEILEVLLPGELGIHDVYLVYNNANMSASEEPGVMFDWFRFGKAFPGSSDSGYKKYKITYFDVLAKSFDHTLVMYENPSDHRRNTFVFDRGNWQVPLEQVHPGAPDILGGADFSTDNSRLDFARWIVDEENPLTARTFVNRIWEQIFGQGIVITTEDLGSQGSPPSHQELLDWLAYTWMHDDKWSVKTLIKRLVMSETYQQSSHVSARQLEEDPYNIFLSRGPRVRLSAEQIRDQALSLSGLLHKKQFGPPVMPFQPEGIWQTPYNNQSWVTSDDNDQYRRGIYTFVKRSGLYPSMETFDLSPRQVCVSRRIRTNTPLQALVTLNDPVYVEAATHLALKMISEGGQDIADKIDYAYQLAMGRKMNPAKLEVLENLYQQSIAQLELEKEQDQEIEKKDDYDMEVIAMTNVASALLNLDELLNN